MDALTMIRKGLIRGVWLLAILLALTLIINLSWFDEELHPDVAQLVPPEPVSMEGNAFPLVLGFRATEDRDAREVGLQIIDRLRSRFAAGETITLSDAEMQALRGDVGNGRDWQGVFSSIACNSASEAGCAELLIADVRRSTMLESRHRTLLGRYEEVLRAESFTEIQEYDAATPVPDYGALLDTARVALALSYRDKTTLQFLGDVERDIALWRRMLRDGHSLIAKMVALAGLRNDTLYLSALMRNEALGAEHLTAVRRMVTPLSAQERDIGETFIAEMRIALLSGKDLAVLIEGPSSINRLALQENATINETYFRTTVPLQLRASLSAADFYAQRAYESLRYDFRLVPPPLYNLGGRLVLKWAAERMNTQDYISRVHDLDGRMALVLLQAEIEASPDEAVADIVQNSSYRNPYTEEPMNYDQTAGTIGFNCLGSNAVVCTVAIVSS